MKPSFDVLAGSTLDVKQVNESALLSPFSSEALAFTSALSIKILSTHALRVYPELIALAFWMRPSNIAELKIYSASSGNYFNVARGTVLHIAPSNVDTIFVYSWVLSLLSGNRNIIRLSSRNSNQSSILVRLISDLLNVDAHKSIKDRTMLVQYAPNDVVTTHLSGLCDLRVIWGGDNTVNEIRKITIPPTALEVAFANKCSVALVNVVGWENSSQDQKHAWISSFYNDAYWFDQMACSSPKLVYWIYDGIQKKSKTVREEFWAMLESFLKMKEKKFSDIDYVNKLVASNSLAIKTKCTINSGDTNNLVRIFLDNPLAYESYNCGSGLFLEAEIDRLETLTPLLSRKIQTVTHAGFTDANLRALFEKMPIEGVDRVVPFGGALDFSPIWDGCNLFDIFLRKIFFK